MSKTPINKRVVEFLESLLSSSSVKSKAAIANDLGVSPATVSEIMRFKQGATTEFIAKLVEVYEANAVYLLTGKEILFNKTPLSEGKPEIPPYETLDIMKKVAAFEQDIKLRDLQYEQLTERFNDVLVKLSEVMQKQDAMEAELKKAVMH